MYRAPSYFHGKSGQVWFFQFLHIQHNVVEAIPLESRIPNAGKSVRRIGNGFGHESEDGELTSPRCAQAHGFSLHANVFIDKGNRDKLERLIKYTARPPLKSESLAINQNGDVVLKLKKRWNDGSTAVVYSPIEFIEKLVALIPPYRSHLLRYSGVFSPHSKLRSRVIPQAVIEVVASTDNKPQDAPKPKIKSGRIPWARLLRRCFKIDIEVCPHCNGKTRVVAALFSRSEVSRFLTHMGLEASPPKRFATRMPTLFSVD